MFPRWTLYVIVSALCARHTPMTYANTCEGSFGEESFPTDIDNAVIEGLLMDQLLAFAARPPGENGATKEYALDRYVLLKLAALAQNKAWVHEAGAAPLDQLLRAMSSPKARFPLEANSLAIVDQLKRIYRESKNEVVARSPGKGEHTLEESPVAPLLPDPTPLTVQEMLVPYAPHDLSDRILSSHGTELHVFKETLFEIKEYAEPDHYLTVLDLFIYHFGPFLKSQFKSRDLLPLVDELIERDQLDAAIFLMDQAGLDIEDFAHDYKQMLHAHLRDVWIDSIIRDLLTDKHERSFKRKQVEITLFSKLGDLTPWDQYQEGDLSIIETISDALTQVKASDFGIEFSSYKRATEDALNRLLHLKKFD